MKTCLHLIYRHKKIDIEDVIQFVARRPTAQVQGINDRAQRRYIHSPLSAKNEIKVSMTEIYNSYSKAITESVNGLLKQEFLLKKYDYDIKNLKKIIEQSIEIHNDKRPHISYGILTTNKMHMQNEIRKPVYS